MTCKRLEKRIGSGASGVYCKFSTVCINCNFAILDVAAKRAVLHASPYRMWLLPFYTSHHSCPWYEQKWKSQSQSLLSAEERHPSCRGERSSLSNVFKRSNLRNIRKLALPSFLPSLYIWLICHFKLASSVPSILLYKNDIERDTSSTTWTTFPVRDICDIR